MMRVEKIHDEQRMRMRMMNGKRARKEYCLYSRKMRRSRNRINFTIYRISLSRPNDTTSHICCSFFTSKLFFSYPFFYHVFFASQWCYIFSALLRAEMCCLPLISSPLFASFPFHITQVSKATCYMLSSEKKCVFCFCCQRSGGTDELKVF